LTILLLVGNDPSMIKFIKNRLKQKDTYLDFLC
jgi:hypothetical protein